MGEETEYIEEVAQEMEYREKATLKEKRNGEKAA